MYAFALHGTRVIINHSTLRVKLQRRYNSSFVYDHRGIDLTSPSLSLCEDWLIDSGRIDSVETLNRIERDNNILLMMHGPSDQYNGWDNVSVAFYLRLIRQWDLLESNLERVTKKAAPPILYVAAYLHPLLCSAVLRNNTELLRRSSLYQSVMQQPFDTRDTDEAPLFILNGLTFIRRSSSKYAPTARRTVKAHVTARRQHTRLCLRTV